MPLCVVCGDWARIQPEDWAGEHHQYCPLNPQPTPPLPTVAEAFDLISDAGYPAIPCGAD